MYESPVRKELKKAHVKHLKKLWKYLLPQKKWLIGMIIALTTASSAMLSVGYGMKYLIDSGIVGNDPDLLDRAIMVLFGIVVVLAFSSFFRFYCITRMGEAVVAAIRKDLFKHLISLSPAFYELRKVGEVISRITTDTTVIQSVVGSSISIALRNTIMLIGSTIMLIVTSPKLAGVIAVVVPVIVLPIIILGKKVRKRSRESQAKVAAVSNHINESLMGIKTVQAYGRQGHEFSNFTRFVDEAFEAAIRRVTLRGWLVATVILLTFSVVGTVLWMGGHSVIQGEITPGQLSAFVFYSVLLAGSFGALSEVIGDVQRAAGAAEEMMELLDEIPEIQAPENPVPLPEKIKGEIKFEHVVFAYASRKDKPAVNDITFTVNPGETVAIVGPSGVGKSTMFQLLLRFYDPQSGAIYLDGIDIKTFDPYELRKPIALVSQDPAVFSTTIRNNISYGKLNATDDEILEVAKQARCYDFIQNLPDGLDTYVGERGVRLSGGEKQRLAIARAFIKQPKLLLLDEATNALDAENEQLVQEALDKLKGHCTTLVIAHRLATVMEADRIIVMNHGAIEAIGTHEELVKQGNLYQKLASLQFGDAA